MSPDVPATKKRGAIALRTILTPLPWLVVVFGVLISEFVAPLATHKKKILLTCIVLFFLFLILRLAVVALLQVDRRVALLLLMAAVLSWFSGSAWINSVRVGSPTEFPAPGEWLFLVSYLGLAGYLLRDVDVDRPRARHARGWLDVVIICGGTACLASLLLVTPIRVISGLEGLALLLALIYPLANLVLALVVLGQSLMDVRKDRRKTWMIGVAFVLLMCAESGFALQESASNYDFGNISYALWGGGFALLVAAACRPERPVPPTVPKSASTPLLVGAGLIALMELTIQPDDALIYYTVPPAVLTLLAVAARLALALRDAKRTNEAFEMSYTDELTKLPNRRAMQIRLAKGLADRTPLALMLLDLDGFKEINDSLGHHAGDAVLTLVGLRMREMLGPRAMVARLGGDEFAIILESTDEKELMGTAHEMLTRLAEPTFIDDRDISPSASIGVTVARPDDSDSGSVLRRADVAMYQAKKSGLGVALYDTGLERYSQSRLTLAEELHDGIAEGQIEVWYQPQIEAATMRVSGLEALLRWRHPTQGILGPASFLAAARRVGLMNQLSELVVQQAIDDFDTLWRTEFDLRVAINCAPPELLGSTFLPYLYAAISEAQIDADHLVLEVTEETFFFDLQHTRDVLRGLRSHGVQISVDDYGTGFSSLTYLRNLPMHELKIARALIADVAVDDRSRKIVASTIQLAHALGLRIVAEGVQNAADFRALSAMDVDTVQGYYFAQPMPAHQCTVWIRDWNTTNCSPLHFPFLQGREQEPELERNEA